DYDLHRLIQSSAEPNLNGVLVHNHNSALSNAACNPCLDHHIPRSQAMPDTVSPITGLYAAAEFPDNGFRGLSVAVRGKQGTHAKLSCQILAAGYRVKHRNAAMKKLGLKT
ncbi:MAG TPA: hypothetical protein VK633_09670, partial [Verrucomicrobiae bacterium]|nr:hypothetical protein [Verrucomicrobiae bacterium]